MLKEELEIIKQGILNEVEGYEFYRMASKQAEGIGSKEAFLLLAEEELKHTQYLKVLFDKVKNETTDDLELAFLENPPSPDIYNWEKVNQPASALAMSVFSVGIQMEREAIIFYTSARDKTKLAEAKKIYELLISWEEVHLAQFTQQYELYKDEWWSYQGFSPF